MTDIALCILPVSTEFAGSSEQVWVNVQRPAICCCGKLHVVSSLLQFHLQIFFLWTTDEVKNSRCNGYVRLHLLGWLYPMSACKCIFFLASGLWQLMLQVDTKRSPLINFFKQTLQKMTANFKWKTLHELKMKTKWIWSWQKSQTAEQLKSCIKQEYENNMPWIILVFYI